jgi:hypothetical protein
VSIRRTCGTHASWLVAFSLALLMLSLAVASASAQAQPTLSAPQVSPRDTTFGTAVDFSVTYTDTTAAAPRSVQVQIGDLVKDMASTSKDYAHGASFRVSVTTISVGWHAITFIATSATGDRQVLLSGSLTVHHAGPSPSASPSPSRSSSPSATPNPSPSSTPTPPATPSATTTAIPGESATPTATATATPKPATPKPATPKPATAKPAAETTPPPAPTVPSHAAATPSRTPATPAVAGANGSQSPLASGDVAGGPDAGPSAAADSLGGREVDGAAGSTPSGAASGHDLSLIQAARGGSGGVNSGGIPSYLVINYHAPLSQLIVQLAPTISTAAGGTAAWAAFVLFGKRRRDGGVADPDAELATAAATGLEVAAGQGLTTVDESLMPRWRRPSLQQVRRTDPLRVVAETPSLSFAASGLQTCEDYERRQIRYRLVRLLDCPDELRSAEIGVLDRGDEVLLLERRGVYWLVLCPDGRQGWVHRMTLSDPAAEQGPEVVPWADPAIAEQAAADGAFPEAVQDQAPTPAAEPAEPGFLEAYMQARSEALRAAEPAAPSVPVAEPSTEPAPAGEPGCAGARCSGRKSAGTRKASAGSRPGTKSRRPSR